MRYLFAPIPFTVGIGLEVLIPTETQIREAVRTVSSVEEEALERSA